MSHIRITEQLLDIPFWLKPWQKSKSFGSIFFQIVVILKCCLQQILSQGYPCSVAQLPMLHNCPMWQSYVAQLPNVAKLCCTAAQCDSFVAQLPNVTQLCCTAAQCDSFVAQLPNVTALLHSCPMRHLCCTAAQCDSYVAQLPNVTDNHIAKLPKVAELPNMA